MDILQKKPLFHQDFKHILDYLRLEAPAALQSSSLQHTNSTIDTSHIVSCLKYCKLKSFMQIQKSLVLHRIFSKPLYCKVIQLRHSYIVFQLKSIIRCETSFSHIWHMEVHPGQQAKLALTTIDKKTFCVLHERAGFSSTGIRVSACG